MIGALVRRRKTLAAVAAIVLVGCGAKPPPVPVAPPPPTTEEGATEEVSIALPVSPTEESARLLAVAASSSDLRERCRLLAEATRLDPSSLEAHVLRAETRCAPASELVDDARAAFDLAHDTRTATQLAIVARRARRKTEALAACAVLAKGDAAAKLLAGRTWAAFGEHARAAEAFADGAADRAAAGATLDALEARLDSAIALAHANDAAAARALLLAQLTPAASASKGYGAAWVGPKVVEAIATVRNAGDEGGAALVAEQALAKGVLVTPEGRRALDLERAIAAARKGKTGALAALVPAAKARPLDRASRAAVAVHARATGACAAAQAHARAHDWLAVEGLRLDEDVAWARACGTPPEVPATVVRPVPDDDVADLLAVAAIDPTRARARAAALAKERPGDVAATLAWIELSTPSDRPAVAAAAIAAMPREPWVLATALASLPSRAEAGKRLANEVVPRTVEGATRAAGAVLAFAIEVDATILELDEALLRACAAAPTESACALGKDATALAKAARALRSQRPAVLAKLGPALSDADLRVPALRLDVVLALLHEKKLAEARVVARRGPFPDPEGAVARASIAAAAGDCKTAKPWLENVDASFADDLAPAKKACP